MNVSLADINSWDDGQEMRYPLIQTLLYDTPLMIAPAKADVLHSVLQSYVMGNAPAINAAEFQRNNERKPYQVTQGGVAVIPVFGTLAHRGGFLDAMSGITSYRALQARVGMAARDADVKAILLETDTPGGAVSGLYGLTDTIRAVAAEKPVWAIANEEMFSAGYAIGAAASRVIAPETAMAGSIGVIMMHRDQSKANEKAGRKYTPIYAGHHKIDGSPHAPLSEQAMQTYQHLVDDAYRVFVSHVAQGRAAMSEQDVIDTQAQIYTANDAVDIGLIDQIATYEETLDLLEAHVRPAVSLTRASARNHQEVKTMSKDNLSDDDNVITQADLDAARAEGVEEGRTAERERVDGILAHAKASANFAQATNAIKTGLSLEQATGVLDAMPEVTPVQANAFAAQMAAMGNPDVSADVGTDDELTDDQLAAHAVKLVKS